MMSAEENSNYHSAIEAQHRLHSGISNVTLRKWQSLNISLSAQHFMYPVFVVEEDDDIQPIPSLPEVYRFGINKLKSHLEPLVDKGLNSILLFGVIDQLPKDENGSHADSMSNPVMRAIPKIRLSFPTLTIACDVCLCPYTSHGHCGILYSDGSINNATSIKRIAQVAVAYAKQGAHIVAPSDMMDGRIGAIKCALTQEKLEHKTAVLSYTSKFASSFYGPFREAAKSQPAFGDRKCYQLPPGSKGLALRAAARDVKEGADFLMVKPALSYLDIVKTIKDVYGEHPLFVYQVSGEYAMIYHAAKAGALDLRSTLWEILTSMRRAGADVIISYYTPIILEWLQLKSKF